jgi:anti-sigma factor ChrR (cupin superfamily)
MKPIAGADRRVANIYDSPFAMWEIEGSAYDGLSYLQVNGSGEIGLGFHVFKMAPGASVYAHEHTSDEEFLMIEGELIENDGTVYRKGDLVWLKAGTQHSSHSPGGCTIVVHVGTLERTI